MPLWMHMVSYLSILTAHIYNVTVNQSVFVIYLSLYLHEYFIDTKAGFNTTRGSALLIY